MSIEGPGRAASAVTVVPVRAGAHLLALPVAQVVEVVRRAATTPIPGTPPWSLGLLTARSAREPAVDLAALLDDREPDPVRAEQRMVRCTTDRGPVTVVVDETGPIESAAVETGPGEARAGVLVLGTVVLASGPALLLDLPRVAELAASVTPLAPGAPVGS